MRSSAGPCVVAMPFEVFLEDIRRLGKVDERTARGDELRIQNSARRCQFAKRITPRQLVEWRFNEIDLPRVGGGCADGLGRDGRREIATPVDPILMQFRFHGLSLGSGQQRARPSTKDA
jgi:hypothetical protein